MQYEIKKEQLAVLIKTTFDIVGSRPSQEVWKLSQKEAELIADPLSGLLQKNPWMDRMTSEYGDWIALIVAIGTVIIPRLLIQLASRPKKEKGEIKPYVAIKKADEKQGSNNQPAAQRRDERGKAADSAGQSNRQSSNASSYIGAELYGIIPAIQ